MLQQIKKNWVQIAIALIIIIVLYRIFAQRKDSAAVAGSKPAGGIGPKKVFKCDENAKLNRDKALRKGATDSQEVCYLQRWLNQYYGAGLKEDGDFGANTDKALMSATNKAYGSLNWIGA